MMARRLTVLLALLFLSLCVGPAPAQTKKAPPKLEVPDDVIFEPNIEYSNPDNQHLQLNLARPKGEGPFPTILCIHGGGFRAGSRQGYDKQCLRLAQHGYVALTISYRLAPKYQFPAAIHDKTRACDIACLVAGQVDRGVSDFFGRTTASGWRTAHHRHAGMGVAVDGGRPNYAG